MIKYSWIKKLRARRINCTRLVASFIYFIYGTVTLIYFSTKRFEEIRYFFALNILIILWCSGWSAIGVVAGLWNSLDDNSSVTRQKSHYFTYFAFVLFVSSLAAFVVFLSATKSYLAYASSALVAIITGFAGDKLASNIFKLK